MTGPRRLALVAFGAPAPQGSKRHVGRGVMVESSKRLAPWRAQVAAAARAAGQRGGPFTSASVRLIFAMPTPKYAAARVRRAYPDVVPHTKRPDVDKLARAVLDALVTGGVLADDSHVHELHATKHYTPDGKPGVHITIEGE